jgi:hypothetical protein
MGAVIYLPGEGEQIPGPSSVTIKATGEQTGGSFYLGEAVINQDSLDRLPTITTGCATCSTCSRAR